MGTLVRNSNLTVIRFFRWFFWAGNAICWLLLAVYGFKWEGNSWAHVEMIGALMFSLIQIAAYAVESNKKDSAGIE